jgi:uncharacterized membrane protein YfcA
MLLEIFFILVGTGLCAGILGSMIGVGGGIIIAPVLTFLGYPPSHISSTSLIAVTASSASSTITFSRVKRIDYKVAIKIALLAIPGSVAGALISEHLSISSFKLMFAVIMILSGFYIIYKNRLSESQQAKNESFVAASIFYIGAFLAGIVSSLFGIGGGIIFVPLMIIIIQMTMSRAAATSQFTLLLTSITGVITHALLNHPDYLQALSLVFGAIVGAQIGSRLSLKVNDSFLRKILAISLFAASLKIIYDWLVLLIGDA